MIMTIESRKKLSEDDRKHIQATVTNLCKDTHKTLVLPPWVEKIEWLSNNGNRDFTGLGKLHIL